MLDRIGRKLRSAVIGNLERWLIHGSKAFIFGGHGATASGAVVTEHSALSIGAHMTCVRIVSEDIGSLPRHIYRRDPKDPDRREVAYDHPLYSIVHAAPNPWQTSMEFWETRAAEVRNWGDSFALMDFDSRYNVKALWPLEPWRMTVERAGDYRGWQPVYRYHTDSGTQDTLDPAAVLHIRGLGFDGLRGRSVVQHFAETLGTAQTIARYGASFFANNARGDFYLLHPKQLGKEAIDKLRAQVEDRGRGPNNWHRPMILEEGMEPKMLALPFKDVMALEALKDARESICGWHRVPLHKAGILDHATFSNVEHLALAYVGDAVRPDAERIEQAIERTMLGPKEAKEYFVEHNLEGLLRGDIKTRFEAYATGINAGFMKADTVTRRENLPAIQGGDWRTIPANMNIFDKDGNPVATPQSAAKPQGAQPA
jgi:HK97 family phage portal protein